MGFLPVNLQILSTMNAGMMCKRKWRKKYRFLFGVLFMKTCQCMWTEGKVFEWLFMWPTISPAIWFGFYYFWSCLLLKNDQPTPRRRILISTNAVVDLYVVRAGAVYWYRLRSGKKGYLFCLMVYAFWLHCMTYLVTMSQALAMITLATKSTGIKSTILSSSW